jgi:hypothetical protein
MSRLNFSTLPRVRSDTRPWVTPGDFGSLHLRQLACLDLFFQLRHQVGAVQAGREADIRIRQATEPARPCWCSAAFKNDIAH